MIRLSMLAFAGLTVWSPAPAPLAAQKPFEGVVKMRMTMLLQGGATSDQTVYIKGNRMRTEISMMGMQINAISDLDKGTMTMLMPAQKTYMTQNIDEAAQAMARQGPPPEVKVEPTGAKETVLGIPCEYYRVTVPTAQSETDMCIAKGMGMFLGSMPALGRPGSPGVPGMEKLAAEFKDGAFVLKMALKNAGQTVMTMEATGIEKKPVDSSLFTVPEGYQKMEGGMGRRPPGR